MNLIAGRTYYMPQPLMPWSHEAGVDSPCRPISTGGETWVKVKLLEVIEHPVSIDPNITDWDGGDQVAVVALLDHPGMTENVHVAQLRAKKPPKP
jgi:hypothetical protein